VLYLLVRSGSDAYAIEASRVRRIVPFARLKSLPSGMAEVAGVLNYHGVPVPVLDLTRLLSATATREQLFARIILADVALADGESRLLGLLAEGVHSVVRFDPEAFRPAGLRPDGRPWLGPVVEHDREFIQRIEVAELLPATVLDALIRDSEGALAV
jgi:chemotaxis-related protein WspB